MPEREHRLASIMYVNLAGFSTILEQNENKALELLDYLTRMVNRVSEDFDGTVIKTVGDTFLVSFNTALNSVECAVKVQNDLSIFNESRTENPLAVRIGVHLGDIYFYEDDALGEGVSIASRLQSVCRPGSIVVSSEVYNQVGTRLQVKSRSLGKIQMKNMSKEVHAWELLTRSSSKSVPSSAGTSHVVPETKQELKDLIKNQAGKAAQSIGEQVQNVLQDAEQQARKESGGAGPMREAVRALEEDYLPWERFYRRMQKKVDRGATAFRVHFTTWAAVNGFLLFINFMTGGAHPWFLYPAAGWGIGLFIHWTNRRITQKQSGTLEKLGRLPKKIYRTVRKLFSSRRGFANHAAVTAAVTGFLTMVWAITGAGYPWFLYPAAALGTGLLIHSTARGPRYAKLKQTLKRQLAGLPETERRTETGKSAHVSAEVREARTLRQAILRQYEKNPKHKERLGEDMTTLLDTYVQQVEDLDRRKQAIEEVMTDIPKGSIEDDRDRMRQKMISAGEQGLKEEYRRAMSQIDHQLESYKELEKQQDVVTVRMSSAVQSLRQLQLDLSRMDTADTPQDAASFRAVRDRSDEMSQYLRDLREGYEEIERDL